MANIIPNFFLALGAEQFLFLAIFSSSILFGRNSPAVRIFSVIVLSIITYVCQKSVNELYPFAHRRGAIVPLLWIQFMSASDLILVRRLSRGDLPTQPASTTVHAIQSVKLLWNLRRVGTNWQAKNTPPVKLINQKTQGYVSFLTKRFAMALIAYLVLEGLIQAPSPDPSLVTVPKQATLNGLRELSFDDFVFRVIGTLSFWFTTMLINTVLAYTASLVMAFLGLCGPKDSPPLYGSISSAWSVRQFWGETWHQCLRNGLAGHTDLIMSLIYPFGAGRVSRYLKLFISFFLSGLIHHSSDVAMGIPSSDAGSLRFFMLQPVGIMLEDTMQAIFPQTKTSPLVARLRVIMGYLWVVAFLSWSTPTWFYPQLRLDADATDLLPIHLTTGLSNLLAKRL